MLLKNNFCIGLIIIASISGRQVYAQKIGLKDVVKIECVVNRGAMRRSIGNVEVVFENNAWNSYQTYYYPVFGKDRRPFPDSTRKFLKVIPNDKLIQLLTYISQPDSVIKYDTFGINSKDMIKLSDDSIVTEVTPKQRVELNKALRSRSLIEKIIKKSAVPTNLFYNYQYYFTVTTKTNKTYRINGLAFQNVYHMPWVVNNVKVYNPEIAEVFEWIMGDELFAVTEKTRMYNHIILDVFFEKFGAKFAWEDLQTDFPEGYALLKNKKRPIFFQYTKKYGWYGAFPSPQLPFYLHPYTRFNIGDTAAINRLNRFQDTLENAYKRGCFLFEYLKKFPKCEVQAMAGSGGKITKIEFDILKAVYPEIAKYSYKDVQVLNVDGDSKVYSKWLLFPNNWVMLQSYTGKLASVNADLKFSGLVPLDLSNRSNNDSGMFDNTGKRVDRTK
jgi:hypothetical protein